MTRPSDTLRRLVFLVLVLLASAPLGVVAAAPAAQVSAYCDVQILLDTPGGFTVVFKVLGESDCAMALVNANGDTVGGVIIVRAGSERPQRLYVSFTVTLPCPYPPPNIDLGPCDAVGIRVSGGGFSTVYPIPADPRAPATPTPVPTPTPTPEPDKIHIEVNGVRVMVPGDLGFAALGRLPAGMDPAKATVTLEVDGRETLTAKLDSFADRGILFSTSGSILRAPSGGWFDLGPLATIMGVPPEQSVRELPQQLSVRAVLRGDGKVVASDPITLTFVDWDGRLGQWASGKEAAAREPLAWLGEAQALGRESEALTPAMQESLGGYNTMLGDVGDALYRFLAAAKELIYEVNLLTSELQTSIEGLLEELRSNLGAKTLEAVVRVEQVYKEHGLKPPFSAQEAFGDQKKTEEYNAAFAAWQSGFSPEEVARMDAAAAEAVKPFVEGLAQEFKDVVRENTGFVERAKELAAEAKALRKGAVSEVVRAVGPDEGLKQLGKDISAALYAWRDYTLKLRPLETRAATVRDSLRQAQGEAEALVKELREAAQEPSAIGREEDYLRTADLLEEWATYLGGSAEGVGLFLGRTDKANEVTARLAVGDRTLHVGFRELFWDVFVSPAIALPQPLGRLPERVTREAPPVSSPTAVPAAAFGIPTLFPWRADVALYPKYSPYKLSQKVQEAIRQEAEEIKKWGVGRVTAGGKAAIKSVVRPFLVSAVGGLDHQQEEGLAMFYAAEDTAAQLAAGPLLPAMKAHLPVPVLEVALGSPATLLVVGADGRKAGFDASLGQPVEENPGAIYAGSPGETQQVLILFPKGLYTVQLTGTAEGEYDLWAGYADGGELTVESYSAGIQQRESISLDLSMQELVEEIEAEGDGAQATQRDIRPRLVLAPVTEAAPTVSEGQGERGWPLLWIAAGAGTAAALFLAGAALFIWKRLARGRLTS